VQQVLAVQDLNGGRAWNHRLGCRTGFAALLRAALAAGWRRAAGPVPDDSPRQPSRPRRTGWSPRCPPTSWAVILLLLV